MKDFAKSIVCNSKVGNAMKDDAKAKALYKEMMDAKELAEQWGRWAQTNKGANLEGGRKSAEEAYRKAKKAYEDYAMNSKTGNKKVGNGSGRWRGNFYEDSAGNSATVMKNGNGWEVVWEDFRGNGKSVGVYKDQNTAKKVAEDVVESEMPDRIKANYRSQAINSKVGNASTFDRLDDAVHYASNLTDEALRRLNGTFSATNLISTLSKCKQACDDAIKLAQQYDREINK